MPHDSFMTPAQAAEALNISARQVQNWCKAGDIEHCRVGRSYRIPAHAVHALLRQRDAAPPTVDIGQVVALELSSLVQAWLWDMANGTAPRSPETIRTHRLHLAKCVRMLVGARPGAQLTYLDVISEGAMRQVMAMIPPHQFASRYNHYMGVMSFVNFLVARGIVGPEVKLPLKALKPRRLTPPKRTSLRSEAEVNQYLDAIWQHEAYSPYEKHLNATVVGVMAFAGLRVGEVAKLELAHLDLPNRLLHVVNGKGGKARLVGINARLQGLLEAYLAVRPTGGDTRLFLSARGTLLARDYLIRRLRRVRKFSGIEVSAHGLRRTFATLASNAGRPINLIQLALGHAAISTTQQYLMADQHTAAKAMQEW
jgi:excisionase family DNA binding protein